MTQTEHRGWAVWFVGLPGSGKSSVARAVLKTLREMGRTVAYLEMDARRRVYFAHPTYSVEERAQAYDLFVQEAFELVRLGQGVIMDGTAHRRAARAAARANIKRFAEVYVRCPLEVAIAREKARPEGVTMAGLYEKALERRLTGRQFPGLGVMVGVDEPFEEDPGAECVVDSATLTIVQARDQVLRFLEQWLP